MVITKNVVNQLSHINPWTDGTLRWKRLCGKSHTTYYYVYRRNLNVLTNNVCIIKIFVQNLTAIPSQFQGDVVSSHWVLLIVIDFTLAKLLPSLRRCVNWMAYGASYFVSWVLCPSWRRTTALIPSENNVTDRVKLSIIVFPLFSVVIQVVSFLYHYNQGIVWRNQSMLTLFMANLF